jgi:hypothetical protein
MTGDSGQPSASERKRTITKAPFDCAPFDHAQGLRQGPRQDWQRYEDTKEDGLTQSPQSRRERLDRINRINKMFGLCILELINPDNPVNPV